MVTGCPNTFYCRTLVRCSRDVQALRVAARRTDRMASTVGTCASSYEPHVPRAS